MMLCIIMACADILCPMCLSVCLSHSCIVSKRVIISSNFFDGRITTPFWFSFNQTNVMAKSDGDPHNWGKKIVIFDKYLALGSMTGGVSSVVNIFVV